MGAAMTDNVPQEYHDALQKAEDKEREKERQKDERGDGMPHGSPPPEEI